MNNQIENSNKNNLYTWSASTKILVGFALLIVASFLFYRFVNFLSPIMIAAVIIYLMHPLIKKISSGTALRWKGSVNLIFLLTIVILIGVFTFFGVTIITQIQGLVETVSTFIDEFPRIYNELTNQVIEIDVFGRFYWEIDISKFFDNLQFDLLGLTEQIINFVKPMVGQAGSMVGSIASHAANFIVWIFFIIMTSYFVLADMGESPKFFSGFKGRNDLYNDLTKLLREFDLVWDTYIRGQIVIVVLVFISNFIIMSILGIRGAIAIALIAGLARFLPYIGAFISGITVGVVALIQGNPYFEMNAFTYALIVLACSMLLDTIFDNIITPSLLGNSLGVHPAFVLLASLVLLQLIGFIGLLLAAPILASVLVFGRYIIRKMLDLDPWTDFDKDHREPLSLSKIGHSIIQKVSQFIKKISSKWKEIKNKRNKNNE